MKCRAWPIMAAVLLLMGCGEDAAAPEQVTAEATQAVPEPETVGPERHILAFGDSLFAGYNVGEGESYPARLEAALRRQGINARVTNAGVSGDTTAVALQRLEFVLEGLETPPDLALVEFGGNDLLRGISPAETRENLTAVMAEFRERNIPVLLMGMRAPPNLGEAYVREFDAIYPALAGQFDAELVPFFLEPVYDQPALIQPDRVHPTAAGIEAIVAATADDVTGALPDE